MCVFYRHFQELAISYTRTKASLLFFIISLYSNTTSQQQQQPAAGSPPSASVYLSRALKLLNSRSNFEVATSLRNWASCGALIVNIRCDRLGACVEASQHIRREPSGGDEIRRRAATSNQDGAAQAAKSASKIGTCKQAKLGYF